MAYIIMIKKFKCQNKLTNLNLYCIVENSNISNNSVVLSRGLP